MRRGVVRARREAHQCAGGGGGGKPAYVYESLVFSVGAIVLGVRQVRLGENRSERFVGVALLLGGAFTAIEGLIRLLSGAAP